MTIRLSKLVCASIRHPTCTYSTHTYYKAGKPLLKSSRLLEITLARTMGTFNLPNSDPSCAVSLPDNLTEEKVMSFRPFINWVSTLQTSISSQSNSSHPFHSSPYKLRGIQIQSVDFFGQRIGFLKLRAEVTNDQGDWLPGAVFMRGPSVTMMVNNA
jgi:ADP-sugar diphosphatase